MTLTPEQRWLRYYARRIERIENRVPSAPATIKAYLASSDLEDDALEEGLDLLAERLNG